MKIYIFDLDGTVFKWQSGEDYWAPHYFRNLPSDELMVKVVNRLLKAGENVVFGTAVLNEEAAFDKREALNELGFANVPMIAVKNGYTKDSILKTVEKRILIDDYTKNLINFSGIGVKYCNGINDTNKTWNGLRISTDMSAEEIYNLLRKI